ALRLRYDDDADTRVTVDQPGDPVHRPRGRLAMVRGEVEDHLIGTLRTLLVLHQREPLNRLLRRTVVRPKVARLTPTQHIPRPQLVQRKWLPKILLRKHGEVRHPRSNLVPTLQALRDGVGTLLELGLLAPV